MFAAQPLSQLTLPHCTALHGLKSYHTHAPLLLQSAVSEDKVESLTLTVGTQRRSVLEAIAFGTFLRDVETHVNEEYGLLTPALPPGPSGGGRGGGGSPFVGV